MWTDLDSLLLKPSELAPADFTPGEEIKSMLSEMARVLVIGAGGLGCEILKDLALSGFRIIEVIDLDRVDITNLNRQFLFRAADVGSYKAEVAAKFVMSRVPQCDIKFHTRPIQEFDADFFMGFHIIIAGLDNVPARRWLNSLLHNVVEFDADNNPSPENIRPYIDGGSEGFKGQARVVIPFQTACYECTLPLQGAQTGVPMCTIAETPRIPEHCIEYAYIVEWEKEFPGKKVDTDSPEDMTWIFEKAKERADTFGIEGVTYMKTIGVVKNVIPAIASTNALISAACVAEALKVATYVGKPLDNYFMYLGQTNITTGSYPIEKREDCLVCSSGHADIDIKRSQTLRDLIDKLKNQEGKFKMDNPAISTNEGTMYIPKPPALEQHHRFKLDLTFPQLIEQGHYKEAEPLIVTDSTVHSHIKFNLALED